MRSVAALVRKHGRLSRAQSKMDPSAQVVEQPTPSAASGPLALVDQQRREDSVEISQSNVPSAANDGSMDFLGIHSIRAQQTGSLEADPHVGPEVLSEVLLEVLPDMLPDILHESGRLYRPCMANGPPDASFAPDHLYLVPLPATWLGHGQWLGNDWIGLNNSDAMATDQWCGTSEGCEPLLGEGSRPAPTSQPAALAGADLMLGTSVWQGEANSSEHQ